MSAHRARYLYYGWLPSEASGAGTVYPFEGLQNAGKWATRVKKWRATGVTINDTVNSQTFDMDVLIETDRANEQDTMLNPQSLLGVQIVGSPEIQFVVQLELKPIPMKDGTSYFPYLSVALNINADNDGAIQGVFTGYSVDPGTSEYTDALTFDANAGTGYYTNTADGFPPGQFVVTGTIVITPEEFWPWAAREGSPIYDTSTGDVLSGQSPAA